MKLEACPLCELVKEVPQQDRGEYCTKVNFGSMPAAVLLEHEGTPPNGAVLEAMSLLGNGKGGMIEEIKQVPGHWALCRLPGSWASQGRSDTMKE